VWYACGGQSDGKQASGASDGAEQLYNLLPGRSHWETAPGHKGEFVMECAKMKTACAELRRGHQVKGKQLTSTICTGGSDHD